MELEKLKTTDAACKKELEAAQEDEEKLMTKVESRCNHVYS
jgi:hypothetical protein